MAINFQYYPKSKRLTEHLEKVKEVFQSMENEIFSENNNTKQLKSNEVLNRIEEGLTNIGYKVEKKRI